MESSTQPWTVHVNSLDSASPLGPLAPSQRHCESAHDVAQQLLAEVHNFRFERFCCLTKFRADLVQSWMAYYPKFLAWRARADALVADLHSQGLTDIATDIANQLYRDPIVCDPGNFEISYRTGFGDECVTIVGIDGERRHGRVASQPKHAQVPSEAGVRRETPPCANRDRTPAHLSDSQNASNQGPANDMGAPVSPSSHAPASDQGSIAPCVQSNSPSMRVRSVARTDQAPLPDTMQCSIRVCDGDGQTGPCTSCLQATAPYSPGALEAISAPDQVSSRPPSNRYGTWSKQNLRRLCTERHLDTRGKKTALTHRLLRDDTVAPTMPIPSTSAGSGRSTRCYGCRRSKAACRKRVTADGQISCDRCVTFRRACSLQRKTDRKAQRSIEGPMDG